MNIEKLKARDSDEIVKMYNKYHKLLRTIIFQIIKDNDQAEELINDTFMKVLEVIDTFDGKSFKQWMCRIATNKAIDQYRKNQVRRTAEIAYETEKSIYEDLLDEQHIQPELDERLQILNDMPYKVKQILWRKYLLDMSFEEIAEISGKSQTQVKSQFYRALNYARKRLPDKKGS